MLFTLLIFVILIIAVLLSIVVLLQSGRGGGLAGIAAGGQAQQILGARQAPDFLEKASWTLGTLLLVLCFLAPFTIGGDRTSTLRDGGNPAPAQTAPPLGGEGVLPQGTTEGSNTPATDGAGEAAPAESGAGQTEGGGDESPAATE